MRIVCFYYICVHWNLLQKIVFWTLTSNTSPLFNYTSWLASSLPVVRGLDFTRILGEWFQSNNMTCSSLWSWCNCNYNILSLAVLLCLIEQQGNKDEIQRIYNSRLFCWSSYPLSNKEMGINQYHPCVIGRSPVLGLQAKTCVLICKQTVKFNT